jgi:SpoVK/Ycf46/Vps4 family AAA+-type ATPase
MVFVGIPGTGKSLAAKAISQVLGVPLVRLDFGRVFNSFVGRSEERMRVALKMVESMSPCVLFCDEVDKGLGGIGGSGDSGTSSRVLGSFLTWLQENKTPVFTMVTANNITGLPPELLRRGRFDAIFAAGLPNEAERMEILKIHLRKRGYDLAKFPAKDKNNVMVLSAGYVGAEIEAAVQDGLIDAFAAEEKFSLRHVGEALERMVPLSKAHNALIQEMTLWMQNNATPASKSGSQKAEGKNKVTQLSSRRTRVRVTDKTED